MSSAYIVSAELLETAPPASEWHAVGIPPDFSQRLLVVHWDNPNAETAFEAQLGVISLGQPWDPMPPEAAAILGGTLPIDATGGAVTTIEGEVPPTPVRPESVSAALKKIDWPGGRMFR